MIEAHGGELVDRVVGDAFERQLRGAIEDRPTLDLTEAQYQDLCNIASGRFSPITGFLTQTDFLKTVHDMTLEDGTTWPLPITLDVSAEVAEGLQSGQKVGLRGLDGAVVGAMEIEEVYKHNRQEAVEHLFGTSDTAHPGVNRYLAQEDFFVGGPVYLFETTRYNDRDLLPKESRVLFERRGWDTVVGFQTRNAPHRAHEYIQKSALEPVDGLLIQPKLGDKKETDYRDDVILGAYDTLIENYYCSDVVALSVLPSVMRYAGPREAVFDALVRKNQGCTHFVVGRDHAGVGDYYDAFGSQHIFDDIGDVDIEPVFYDYSFYCHRCDGMTSEKICPHDDSEQVHPSGSEIRAMLTEDRAPSEKMMRPEVASHLMETTQPFVGGRSQ